MAKQFKGSAQSRGFGAASASNAAEQRISQQTSRVVAGMERFRDSDLENRKRILKDMEENARYTQTRLERDRNILAGNKGKQAQQVAYDAQGEQQRANSRMETTAAAFKAVANFSETAYKKQQEFEQKKVDEEYWAGVRARQLAGPDTIKQVQYDALTNLEGQAVAEVEGTISIAEANGADPLAVSKARMTTHWGSQGWDDADMALTTQSGWNSYRNDTLSNDTTMLELADGTKFRVNEARGDTSKTAAAIAYAQRKFIEEEGWAGRSAEQLGNSLDYMQKSNMSYLQQEASLETARNDSLLEQGALNSLMTGNVNPVTSNNAYTVLMNANKGDAEKTWTQLEGYVKKGLIPANALAGITMPDGNTLADSPRYRRFMQLQTEAELDQSAMERRQATAVREEKSKEWLALLNSPEATMGDLKAAEEAFKGDIKGTPQWLQKRINANDPQGQQFAKANETYADDMAARGMLTMDLVNKVYEANPIKGAELRKKLEKQNQFVDNDQYKLYKDNLKILVKKSAETTDTIASTGALIELTRAYQLKVEEYAAGGMSIQDAARKAATELESDVASDKVNPEATYFRNWDVTTGTYLYPNLVKVKDVDKAGEERSKAVRDAIYSPDKTNAKLKELLTTKNSVFNDQEIERITKQYTADPAGFKFPASVLMISDRMPGKTPMEVLNTLIKNSGGKELAPPPSMELLQSASPMAQGLLQKYKSPDRSTRGLGMTSTGWNSGAIQPEYVPMIETASTSYGVPPSEISALIDIESGFSPERSSYNGSSHGMMQINKAAHPLFFQNANWRDPNQNIQYGTQYYAGLKEEYGDPVAAAMAYNAGPGNYDAYLRGELPDGPIKTEMLSHGKKFARALYKYAGPSSGMLQRPDTMRDSSLIRSATGALTYEDNRQAYMDLGNVIQGSGFQVAEQADFGGVAPVHAGNSYHKYNEAFDITHQTGDYNTSIAKTKKLKEAIRSLNLFKEVIGPGDSDPNHETHLHVGGLMRPMTPEDSAALKALMG